MQKRIFRLYIAIIRIYSVDIKTRYCYNIFRQIVYNERRIIMKKIVKSFADSAMLLSVIAIVLGAVLIVYPDLSLFAFGLIVGGFLIVQGVILIVLDVKAWSMYIPFEGMLKGILSAILGVLLLRYPENIAVYVGIVLGVYIIVNSFAEIKISSALRFTGAPWVFMLILNVINILLGCIVLYAPVVSAITLTMYIGIILIAYSVVNMAYMIIIKKNIKDVEKIVTEKKTIAKPAVDVEADAE